MLKPASFAPLLGLLTFSLHAQIQIINSTDLISQAPTKLNANFSYLDTNKAGLNRANTYGAFLQRFDAALMRMPERTVAGLPAAASSTNQVFVVTNGMSASDCTVGLGAVRALCISNGSTWVALGGGNLGTVTSVGLLGTANQIVVTGTSPIVSAGTFTLSFASNVTLPGTTTGTFSGNLTGNVTGASSLNLLKSSNLSDLANAATARTNLGGIVVGPSSATDNCAARFDGTTGKLIQNSVVCIDDSGNVVGVLNLAATSITIAGGPTCTPGTGGADCIAEGTAPSAGPASGVDVCYSDSTLHAQTCSYNNGSYFPLGRIIAHGSKALDFASTATGACATVITDTATGAVSTDVVMFNANASIKAVTGYVPASTGGFSVAAFPSADLVSFEACNWTAGTVDPGSITVNWMVVRI